jgi:hypothetical protein
MEIAVLGFQDVVTDLNLVCAIQVMVHAWVQVRFGSKKMDLET